MSIDAFIFVVTSHSYLANSDKQTGWYLPDVAHPRLVLRKAGYKIVFVSPEGGRAPMDKNSWDHFKDDLICQTFFNEHVIVKDGVHMLRDSLTVSMINSTEYKTVFYAGGFGAMYDLPYATDVADLAIDIYKQGGFLSAVSHGLAGFVPLRINGQPLVRGHTVTSITIGEEDAVNLSTYMHVKLETRLKELGATFIGAPNWACNVQVSGRLITGQNPASATKVAEEMAAALGNIRGQPV